MGVATQDGEVAASDLECQACGATLRVEPHHRTGRCAYCASPAVVERPPRPDRPNPTFALGFIVPERVALETARRWVRRPIFAPEAFRRAPVEDIRGVYLPCYLYTAAAHTNYQASIGENYTVTETYTTTDSKGRTVTRTRTRVETEWRPLAGQHAAYLGERVVTASRGVPNPELDAVEPFDLRALRRYTPKLVSGWIAEEPSLAPNDCLKMARDEAMGGLGQSLGRFMPGDSHRELRWQTRFEHEDLELCLLPLWVLAVRYHPDKPPVRLLVNGQTGRIGGKAPVSWWKVAAAVLFGFGLVGLLVLLLVGRLG